MMRLLRRGILVLVLTAIGLSLGVSCIVQRPHVQPVNPLPGTTVRSPVKVHLRDRSTVIYRSGLSVQGDTLRGHGARFSFGSQSWTPASPIPLDSVVGMESFESRPRVVPTLLLTSAAVAASVFGSALAAVAIFGSCPTFYTDSSGVAVLEGEGFSYSIAPLFEQRDVDRLRRHVAKDGRVSIEVRNEALETHYINHLELLEVAHDPGEDIFPDAGGQPIAVRNLTPALSATDASGRDVSDMIASHDGTVFSSASTRLASASKADLQDYIDLTVPNPSRADTVVLVLRLRNSLLNTVLL